MRRLDGELQSRGSAECRGPSAGLETSLADARAFLGGLDDETSAAPWRLTAGDREMFTIPRREVVRNLMLNHWYHHRGQLSVYLRFLDVPVPAIYGRSADENPFVEAG
ncbi:MAG TPA: DinB family protein [Thermoanaerobaculia bacterium]|nr:DinB family protein [Thermoanaerobaculia bacterium]